MRDNQRTGAEMIENTNLGEAGIAGNEELEDIINQHLPIRSVDKVNLQKKPIDIGQRPCSRKRRAMAQMTKDKDIGHVVGKEIQAGVTIGKYNVNIKTTWSFERPKKSLIPQDGWKKTTRATRIKGINIHEQKEKELGKNSTLNYLRASQELERMRPMITLVGLRDGFSEEVKSNMQEKDKAEVVVIREVEGEDQ
ncbi:hypothetical protein PPACK8108_LOCUS24594 [Phakopsora pachyrhizi]|uniref:Uncharacterized protein n=1 Tax=Phakopsora pachyrhizi TaxID=170000 RepID=A0AAV0BSA7_PHAPC|nr:hypothetical protein PPACK8108_LOCUS24594 [Phakopsora pachyrhizi]